MRLFVVSQSSFLLVPAVLTALLALIVEECNAFTPASFLTEGGLSSSSSSSSSSSLRVASTASASVDTTTNTNTNLNTNLNTYCHRNRDRVRQQGCGIPVVNSGDSLLFDPAVEGMWGGTSNLHDRLERGVTFHFAPSSSSSSYLSEPSVSTSTVADSSTPTTTTTSTSTSTAIPATQDAQAWLEEWGPHTVKVNGQVNANAILTPPVFAKANTPVTATVLGRTSLISDDAPGDIQHIVLRVPTGFHYVEGQSLSVIPDSLPTTAANNNKKKEKPRLYSIASTRYGDLLDGNTVSLCVRRAEYTDPLTGQVDPLKAGVCSSMLCDAQPGQTIQIAGPVGKTMLLPNLHSSPDTDIIMVATGTGIAPFRGFLHRLFVEETTDKHMFTGQAWLILGVPTTGGLLYKPELDSMMMMNNNNNNNNNNGSSSSSLRIDYAISREMTNAHDGSKVYVQDVLAQNAQELFQKLENGAHIYFCGLKGMMPGILDALEQACSDNNNNNNSGMVWKEQLAKYKANGQWHVEVY